MAYCKNCGAFAEDNAQYCKECGSPLKQTCTNCGAPVIPNASFCTECGTNLIEQKQNVSKITSSKLLFIILGFIAIVALLVVGCYFLLSNNNSKTDTENTIVAAKEVLKTQVSICNGLCPSDVGYGMIWESVKYDEVNNRVIYTYLVPEQLFTALSKVDKDKLKDNYIQKSKGIIKQQPQEKLFFEEILHAEAIIVIRYYIENRGDELTITLSTLDIESIIGQ